MRRRIAIAATRCRAKGAYRRDRRLRPRARDPPDYVKALTNRGVALQTLGRHQEALAEFGKVLAIDKDHADAHHNEALTLLTLGDYRRGFAAYEWRWQRTGMPARRRSFGKPLWLGEYPLGRKTILLHAEQGLGDTIQFVRYASALAKAGAKVVIEVQPELTDLLARVGRRWRARVRGAATRLRRALPDGEPAARSRPSPRPSRPTSPISRRARTVSPSGASASNACRRRASPSPGRAAPPTPTIATGRLRWRGSNRCLRSTR